MPLMLKKNALNSAERSQVIRPVSCQAPTRDRRQGRHDYEVGPPSGIYCNHMLVLQRLYVPAGNLCVKAA